MEFLCESFEGAADGGDFFLSASETHSRGVHELEVVNHNHFHLVFLNKSSSLGPQFEDGKLRCVIHKEWRSDELFDSDVELAPFKWFQLSCFERFAFDVADVDDETIDQLHVCHFK